MPVLQLVKGVSGSFAGSEASVVPPRHSVASALGVSPPFLPQWFKKSWGRGYASTAVSGY